MAATTINLNPSAYQLGKMFHRSGRRYNPYQPDTEAFTEFQRGKLDAEEEDRLYEELMADGFTPHCSSTKQTGIQS